MPQNTYARATGKRRSWTSTAAHLIAAARVALASDGRSPSRDNVADEAPVYAGVAHRI